MFFKLSKLTQKANIANTTLSKMNSIHERFHHPMLSSHVFHCSPLTFRDIYISVVLLVCFYNQSFLSNYFAKIYYKDMLIKIISIGIFRTSWVKKASPIKFYSIFDSHLHLNIKMLLLLNTFFEFLIRCKIKGQRYKMVITFFNMCHFIFVQQ